MQGYVPLYNQPFVPLPRAQLVPMTALNPDFPAILNNFCLEGGFQEAFPYGDGHINDTYLARFAEPDGQVSSYILQRINHAVFKKPEQVMHNMERVTDHIRKAVVSMGGDPTRKTITLVPTLAGKSYYVGPDGFYWRVSHFIKGANTYQQAANLAHYYHAARTFGEFLNLLSDYPTETLYESIPYFHHTPRRYQAFLDILETDPRNRAKDVGTEINFVLGREPQTRVLVDLLASGAIPERVTHNDTKIDNVMMDDETGEGVCVIDLDTVMPGLAVFDFGDSVRSGANLAAEDEPDTARLVFDLMVFDRLAHGFLDATRDTLTPVEVAHLAFGARLITLEQGIRFLTDYLNGDTYYKTQRLNQNLDRTRTQLKMVADMEAHEDAMEAIIARYR